MGRAVLRRHQVSDGLIPRNALVRTGIHMAASTDKKQHAQGEERAHLATTRRHKKSQILARCVGLGCVGILHERGLEQALGQRVLTRLMCTEDCVRKLACICRARARPRNSRFWESDGAEQAESREAQTQRPRPAPLTATTPSSETHEIRRRAMIRHGPGAGRGAQSVGTASHRPTQAYVWRAPIARARSRSSRATRAESLRRSVRGDLFSLERDTQTDSLGMTAIFPDRFTAQFKCSRMTFRSAFRRFIWLPRDGLAT